MNISEILHISGCRRKLSVSRKDEALGIMAELLASNPAARGVSKESLLTGMTEREELGSTEWATEWPYPTAGSRA